MRKRVTLLELAGYFGVTRPTIYAWLKKYNEANKEQYDSRNIQTVFAFFAYLQKQFGHG
jgi:hypothetical protein